MASGGCEHASGVSSIFRVLDVDDFLFKLFGLQISFGIRNFLAVSKHVSS